MLFKNKQSDNTAGSYNNVLKNDGHAQWYLYIPLVGTAIVLWIEF